LVGKRHKCN